MRILVEDDNTAICGLVREILEFEGHTVVEAHNGVQGIQLFRRLGADLILCDIFMPECDGLELILELRREFPDLTIIAMSGTLYGGTVNMLSVARHFKATEVLQKPFDRTTLLAVIKKAVHNAQPNASTG